ncbi:PEP-CTERM sorting domain-containing protein [Cerasicoccus arenae]|uniref:Ice-binding protein C-terminal domain-containing protein n=1 Tax=Cerasicoccus arenae TaxID=424488 RepID=A0A8J3GD24_9BACT|nr:PEP-CTERM sorting domain-containing protein [Cerasicoccus arenae]MBK1859069.1 PEP-CTERM sorting domain-containing protein [Cerasicoccus arenae]GHC03478.1 hypothetical protein GCM10007047_20090 [Cerasicoccus arenae]
MKTCTPQHLLTLGTLMAVLTGASTLGATTLIDYGPSSSYVSGDVNFARTAGSTGTGPFIFRRSFNDSSADPLSPTSAYSGPTFYGGYQFISSSIDQGFSRQQIRNNASPDTTDQIYLQSFNSGGWLGSDLSLAGVYIFKQDDFGGGLDTGSVALDGISFSTTGFINSADGTINFDGRYVVQIDNGDYYLSQTTLDLRQNNGSFSISGTTLENELWAVYNPSIDLDFDEGSASFNSLSLTGVTAIGLYFEENSWAGTDASSTAYGLGVRSFQATGTSIPEPSTSVLLMGLGGIIAAAFIKRRRSN